MRLIFKLCHKKNVDKVDVLFFMPYNYVMMILRFYSCIILAALACFLGSCASKASVYYGNVDGVVQFDSKPLANAEVYFDPLGDGTFASGIANELGEFELKTADENHSSDIPLGQYRVFFNHEGVASPDVLDENGAIVTPASTFCDVPKIYTNPETSGIVVEVGKGENFFNFNLKTNEAHNEAKN